MHMACELLIGVRLCEGPGEDKSGGFVGYAKPYGLSLAAVRQGLPVSPAREHTILALLGGCLSAPPIVMRAIPCALRHPSLGSSHDDTHSVVLLLITCRTAPSAAAHDSSPHHLPHCHRGARACEPPGGGREEQETAWGN